VQNGPIEYLQQGAARVDDEGNYSIKDLPPGNYQLLAPGGRIAKTIRVRSGDNLSAMNIFMYGTKAHSLKGRLVAPTDDETKMYSVRLLPRDTPGSLLGLVNPEVRYRSSTGDFETPSIPSGEYVLQAIREDMSTHEVALRLDLSVHSDQTGLLVGARPLISIAGKIQMA